MMMQMKQRLLAVGLVMGLGLMSATAHATVWNTGPVWADGAQNYHACNVNNISLATLTDVTVNVYKADGTLLTSAGPLTLSPRRSAEISLFAGNGGYTGFAYCSISSAAAYWQIRGNLVTFRWNGTFYNTLITEPAR